MYPYQQAHTRFQQYLTNYNTQDPKIKLKIIHTMGVVTASQYMAQKMDLSPEDTYLAKIIALLHDIGRFEQLRRYNSFDDAIMPHAQCSLHVLFQEGLIREFVPDPQWDSIIYTAIQYHGVYKMPSNLQGKTKLHASLIRDEDKIDNFRVKSQDSILAMLDVTPKQLGEEAISPHIYNDFMNEKPIKNADRITHMDMWVSYLAYLFDFNYKEAISYLLEQNYINNIVERVTYTNPDTKIKMQHIAQKANQYAKNKTAQK